MFNVFIGVNMIKNKRGISVGIFVLIILILIAIGIGAYFLLTDDPYSLANLGSSVPQPPALPN